MNRTGCIASIFVAVALVASGCGGSGDGSGAASDQPKLSPEEVQKEIQSISPPATKGKAKSK